MKYSNLYLLIFPERGIIKIGKADGLHERIQTLERWWGKVDYEASYYLSASSQVVFRLEKSLHFLLSHHSLTVEEGDGKTELFSAAALEVALSHIGLFCSSGLVPEGLKRGVPRLQPSLTSTRRRGKHVSYGKRSRTLVAGVARIAEQVGRINRLLLILLRKQSRIAYQYDILDGYVYFRIRGLRRHNRVNSNAVMSSLSFAIEDFNGWWAINCCTVTGVGDVIQYKVRLPSADQDQTWHALLSYFSLQSEFLLKQLPK